MCAGIRTRIYIHTRSGTRFPVPLTCSKSKLGRNWQRVGAACQALQTREVVKHKHFGVYPLDLYSLAAGGRACVEGEACRPLAVLLPRRRAQHLHSHAPAPGSLRAGWGGRCRAVHPSPPALLATWGVFWVMAAEQVCFSPAPALK